MPPQAATLPLLIVEGKWSAARELANVSRAQGSPLERQMAVTILGNLARYQGDVEQAWAMVRELVPRGPDTEPEDGLFPYATEMLRLAARLALDASDVQGARDWLRAHDRWLDWSEAVRGRAESRLLWALLHRLEGDLARAERCAREALELLTNPRQALSLLEASRLLGRICMDAENYRDAQRQLEHALSLSESLAVPYERACTLVDLAEARLVAGRSGEARPQLDEARDLAVELGAAPLVVAVEEIEARLATETQVSRLTAREVDVLRLVAEGMTDAGVAERLFISPRTVGQHLQSIYNKLGVSSRAAATRIAIEDRLV